MFAVFFRLFTVLLSSAFSRVLLGAGLGLISGAGILTLLNYFIGQATSNLTSGSGVILGFLHLIGLDTFLSITLGALVTKATIQSAELTLKKLS